MFCIDGSFGSQVFSNHVKTILFPSFVIQFDVIIHLCIYKFNINLCIKFLFVALFICENLGIIVDVCKAINNSNGLPSLLSNPQII